MQVILKWVAKFLLIPLFEKLVVWTIAFFKRKKVLKELAIKNQEKQDAYDNAQTVNDARDSFRDLP